jgi:FkbM family methyltransferase
MRVVREAVKALIKDTRVEPIARWVVKRSRGHRMPFDGVRNEIYDRQASEIIRQVLQRESSCVDVGCHEGFFLRQFVVNAPAGKHFAFEPIPRLAARLRDEFPSVAVHEVALTDRAGEATFYVIPSAPALSGLHRREFVEPGQPREEVTVRTERLDALIPAELKVDLIKIDVEGAEALVLAGAAETLRRSHPVIIFEHGKASSAAFGSSSVAIYELLVDRLGFSVSRLVSWLRRGPSLTRRQFVRARDWYFVAHPSRD